MAKTAGVGVFVFKDNQILLGLRADNNCLALPGGMIEQGETNDEAAKREVFEETGLIVSLPFNTATMVPGVLAVSDWTPDHFVFWIAADYINGKPEVKEPTKCTAWLWMTMDEIAEIPGVKNVWSEQYKWIPYKDWLHILSYRSIVCQEAW